MTWSSIPYRWSKLMKQNSKNDKGPKYHADEAKWNKKAVQWWCGDPKYY